MKTPTLRKTVIITNGYSYFAIYCVYFDGELFPMAMMFDDIDLHSERWRRRLANMYFYENFDLNITDIHQMYKMYRDYCNEYHRELYKMYEIAYRDYNSCLRPYRDVFEDIVNGAFSCKDRECVNCRS